MLTCSHYETKNSSTETVGKGGGNSARESSALCRLTDNRNLKAKQNPVPGSCLPNNMLVFESENGFRGVTAR